MTTQNIYSMVDTWDDAGTTFKGISLSVTDTASASGSLLMDLQVGGASKVSVSKTGDIIANSNLMAKGQTGTIIFDAISGYFINTSTLGGLRWGVAGATSITSHDLELRRDAADTLAQRRSTNPQTFRAYNTFTDLSNYERGKIAWESNVLRIGTEKAGTGSARALELQTDGTTRLTISTGGTVTFSADILTGNFIRSSTGHGFLVNGRAGFVSGTTENIQFRNAAADGFGLLQFGGTTDAFPALKRSTTSLQVRLADDSDFTAIQGKITTETAYTAGAPTATGYLVLYDSAGVAYKVPAEAL